VIKNVENRSTFEVAGKNIVTPCNLLANTTFFCVTLWLPSSHVMLTVYCVQMNSLQAWWCHLWCVEWMLVATILVHTMMWVVRTFLMSTTVSQFKFCDLLELLNSWLKLVVLNHFHFLWQTVWSVLTYWSASLEECLRFCQELVAEIILPWVILLGWC